MRAAVENFSRNRLLAALPRGVYEQLAPRLELLSLSVGTVLCQADEQPTYSYFPTSCLISLMHVMSDGHSTQIAVVGHEGLAGVDILMGKERALARTVVQSPGQSYRLKRQWLTDIFDHHLVFRRLVLRYMRALLAQ